MSDIGTAVTETRNISMIKGEYREFSFTVSWFALTTTAMTDNSVINWALYVRPSENGVIVAETSLSSETTNERTEWYVSGRLVTVRFYPDFSDDQALGSNSYYYDVVLERSDGLRAVPVHGQIEFTPRYTRDDDTEAQILARETDWATDLCAILEDQRTALLGIPETGTTLSSTAGAATALIHVVDGSIFSAADNIGIELDASGYYETTVSSVDSNDIYLTAGLPLTSGATAGNGVYKGRCNHERCGTA